MMGSLDLVDLTANLGLNGLHPQSDQETGGVDNAMLTTLRGTKIASNVAAPRKPLILVHHLYNYA